MALRLSFRVKLLAIVGTATLALVVLMVTGTVLSRHVSRQLDEIRRTYVPKIELEPKLAHEFESISRGLQDAVAAQDMEALSEVRRHKERLLAELASARVIDPAKAQEARVALEDYHGLAEDVSRRIIAGEKGEQLVEAIAAMQRKQRAAAERLVAATGFNRGELTQVFSSAAASQATAARIRLWVSAACLFVLMLLSAWLGRGVLRSVAELTAGFERFGRGEFNAPIPAVSRDELGDVAQRANQMAKDLKRLHEEREQTIHALAQSRQELAVALEATKTTLAELEAFSYSVSHDLRAPLRGIDGFSQALLEDYADQLDDQGKHYLQRVRAGAQRMGELIDDLLKLSRVSRAEMRTSPLDLSLLAREVADRLKQSEPQRQVELVIAEGLTAHGDPQLLRVALENLIGNAWKFTSKKADARIEVGRALRDDRAAFFVRDNGAGFDMAYVGKIFGAFQRLHEATEFPGTGIGLATVQRVIQRHGGKLWAEGEIDKGATLYFTLPPAQSP